MLLRELYEQDGKTAVVAFGRLNPPTVGHAKLVDKLTSIPGDPFLFLSHTQKPKTDPLDFDTKVKFAKQFFPNVTIGHPAVKTPVLALEYLQGQGYTDIIFVAGSDRVEGFQKLFDTYNGQPDKTGKIPFKFNSIRVVSAGERDPDADDVSGMSASKMRAAAATGELEAFAQGVPDKRLAKTMYDAVRKGMGVKDAVPAEGMAEGSEIKIPTEDGITMQDIRLMAGEGKLTKKTVLQAIAVIRKQRKEQGVDEVSSDDENAVHSMLNSMSAEKLLKAYKKLYRKEYPGTSKSELVSKIKSKVRNYRQAYELMNSAKEEVEIDEVSQELARKTAKARQSQASSLRQKAVDEPDMMKAFAHTKAANKAEKKAGQSYNRLIKKEDMSPEEEDEFHVELDKLVHKYFGHSSEEKKKKDIDEADRVFKKSMSGDTKSFRYTSGGGRLPTDNTAGTKDITKKAKQTDMPDGSYEIDFDNLDKEKLKSTVARLIDEIPNEKNKQVIQAYFGLGKFEKSYTIDQIAKAMGVSRSVIFQRIHKVLKMLRHPSKSRELRQFLDSIEENFADGKKPGRKGLAKRSGVNTKASVSSLRKTAKNSSGEKQRMAHWLANMKAGRAKKK